MKKLLKKIILMTMVLSMICGAFPVYAAENADMRKFKETIKGDIFKFGTDVEIYGNDNMQIVDRYTEELDDEYYLEVEDTTDTPVIVAYTTVHRVEKARHYYVKRKSDNKVMVQFSLHGIFKYDGKTSACTDTKLNVYNNDPNIFKVLQGKHYNEGRWAKAECIVLNKRTGTRFGGTFKIGVKSDGSVVTPPMTKI